MPNIGSAKIWWSPLAKMSASTDGEYAIKEQAAIEIDFNGLYSFNQVIEIIISLELYFSFAANFFSGPSECNVMTDDKNSISNIILHQNWYKEISDHDPYEEYFGINTVIDRVGESISSWLDACRTHRAAIAAYFNIRTRRLTIDNEFLSAAQSVEALSRDIFKIEGLSDDEDREVFNVLKNLSKAISLKNLEKSMAQE